MAASTSTRSAAATLALAAAAAGGACLSLPAVSAFVPPSAPISPPTCTTATQTGTSYDAEDDCISGTSVRCMLFPSSYSGRNFPSALCMSSGVEKETEGALDTPAAGTAESNNGAQNPNAAIDGSSSEPWWKSFQLNDAALPESVRADFPILSTRVGAAGADEDEKKPLIYLDSAATSQKPTYVLDKLTEYYLKANSNVHRGAHCLSREATSQYEGARDAIADFVNAPSRNEIVFTSGATEAINLVAYTYARNTLQKGDVVIISEIEHHSNIVPWQIVCEETGATLKTIPVDKKAGTPDWKAFEEMLSEEVKIVSVQHVSNVLGCVNPTDRIVELVRSKAHADSKIVFDACQSVPHMKVDVQALGCDFLAASGHKMCGPTGIGFLWGKEELLNSMPPFMGGGEMIDEVYNDRSTFAPAPARFEAGTPAIAQSIGLGAAIEYLNKIGMDRIEKYEHELGAYLHRRLDEVPGVTVLGPSAEVEDRAALLSFVCDQVHPSDLSTFLDMEGVAIRAGHHCCQPLHRALGYSHSARASLYFYNTKEDVDVFVEKLEETLNFFGSIGESGSGGADGGDDEEFVPFI